MSLRDLWDICRIDVPKNKERQQGAERAFKDIMAQIFPNTKKDINLYIQKPQQMPSWSNSKQFTPKHIVIKLLKDKKKILKASKEK